METVDILGIRGEFSQQQLKYYWSLVTELLYGLTVLFERVNCIYQEICRETQSYNGFE